MLETEEKLWVCPHLKTNGSKLYDPNTKEISMMLKVREIERSEIWEVGGTQFPHTWIEFNHHLKVLHE